MSQFQDIIKLLDQNNINYAVELYIPSLKKSTKFCRLSGKHNKELINILTGTRLSQYHFKNYIFQTLKELCLDKTINIDNLTPIDRIFICLQLRAASVGEVFDNINLWEHIESKKELVFPQESLSLETENFKITLKMPNLKTENSFDKIIITRIEKLEGKTDREYRQSLADMFLMNILSFVESITLVVGDGEELNFGWESLSISQKIDVGYKLNSSTLQEIIKKVTEAYDDVTTQILQYVDSKGENALIEIDPNFFL